jgi:hypothetical protein
MIRLRSNASIFAAPAVLAALLFAAPARADVPPPNECDGGEMAGSSCSTAGPDNDQDGVCVSTTCSSVHPDADGGLEDAAYPCVLCMLPDAGTKPVCGNGTCDMGETCSSCPKDCCPVEDAGHSTTPDASKPAKDAGNDNTLASSSGGCSTSGSTSHEGAWFLGLGAVGVALSALSRRRLGRRRS